jgi:hypothetical protein
MFVVGAELIFATALDAMARGVAPDVLVATVAD